MELLQQLLPSLLGPYGALVLLLALLVVLFTALTKVGKGLKEAFDKLVNEFSATTTQQREEHKQEISRIVEHHREDLARCDKRYDDMRAEVSFTIKELWRKGGNQ